ncbi:hypothetical protein DTO021C3_815 [Paecilomyces variotii]|nr:hypothetical protein DTO169C6_3070 [Paecilomyces variotii]KAJ9265828.1 hypothetical protein DTO195F2_1430 [Paecilomyces variotii]KAJ9291458.1 hypothetical protein DTO021C3_815 [Paecilomyces variotii]KAJ9402744.1 hypothetical protein DTO282F9_154 [Paecilomyces variotii]
MTNPIASLRHIGRMVRASAVDFRGTRSFGTRSTLFAESSQKSIDRNELKPERSEYSKSGTDDEVAGHPSAFDPSKTSPESEVQASCEETRQEGKSSNPLNVSPGNKDVSQARDPTEGGADASTPHSPSSRGAPPKNKQVNKPH